MRIENPRQPLVRLERMINMNWSGATGVGNETFARNFGYAFTRFVIFLLYTEVLMYYYICWVPKLSERFS